MEITLEAIISLVGLFVGGGGGAFFTWRYLRRKAKAEAVTAEVDAAKDMQDMYQQMLTDAKADREDRRAQVEELRADRDHYKQERNELREKMEKLQRSFIDWRMEADNDRSKMKMDIAKLGRKVEALRPFLCGDLTCRRRQLVTMSDDGMLKTKRTPRKEPHDIDPIEPEAL